jgi:hypothetical protein
MRFFVFNHHCLHMQTWIAYELIHMSWWLYVCYWWLQMAVYGYPHDIFKAGMKVA